MSNAATQAGRVLTLTNAIVSAYVGRHHVRRDELPEVLRTVHGALSRLGETSSAAPDTHKTTPAEVKRSITSDHLISFEDGKSYKTLRRHLGLRGLTPEQYRAKWGLPDDYPMTAPIYLTRRSEIARTNQFGHAHRVPGGSVSTTNQNEPALIDEQLAASVDLDETEAGAGDVESERHSDEADGSDAVITREPFEEDGAVDDE